MVWCVLLVRIRQQALYVITYRYVLGDTKKTVARISFQVAHFRSPGSGNKSALAERLLKASQPNLEQLPAPRQLACDLINEDDDLDPDDEDDDDEEEININSSKIAWALPGQIWYDLRQCGSGRELAELRSSKNRERLAAQSL